MDIEEKITHRVDTSLSPLQVFDQRLVRREERGIRCLACARECLLVDQAIGYCTAVGNRGGELYSLAYGVVSEVAVTPIENRPIFHFRPGTRVLSLGGLGCQLRCAFCQNWEVAFRDAHTGGGLTESNVPPERAIELALAQNCQGIAWTFNEPSIAPMYTLGCARLARQVGLFTVFVTNGFMTQEALSVLGSSIDVYRVDIKSLDRDFYRLVARTEKIVDIIPVARRAQQEFGIHVETVTNLMPGLNDSDEHIARIAERIVTELGPQTPWHLTSYVPYAFMRDVPPTPPETLMRARALALQAGLHFVYADNNSTPETMNTYCPSCHMLIIERYAYQVRICGIDDDGTCNTCGAVLGIIV